MNPNIKSAHEFCDFAAALMVEKSAERGTPVTCRAGCSACCDEPAYAVRGEVERALAGLNQAQRDEVAEATRCWLAAVEGSPLLQKEFPEPPAWRQLRATCPFLKNHLCRVYERRPVGCRMFLAVGPRENCEDLAKRPRQQFVKSPEAEQKACGIMLAAAESMEYGHIGELLAEMLLGINMRTRSRWKATDEMVRAGREWAEANFTSPLPPRP